MKINPPLCPAVYALRAEFEKGERIVTPKFLEPGNGPAYGVAGDVYTFLMTGDETDGAHALIEAKVPVHGGPPPHVHHREDEDFYIVEGELTFFVGDQTMKAPAGAFMHAPKNIPHRFQNLGDKPARALIWVRPAGLEKFFAEVGVRLPNSNTPASPPTPADIDKLLAAAPRYGLEIILPPH